jgi:predicted AAA+ superfamily ATPase
MIYERKYNQQLERYLLYFPVVGIIGPRQVGKTTFVKEFLRKHKGRSLYLDLELNSDIIKLQDPEIFLKEHSDKLVVIDEIQHRRDLFPLLRALIDQDYKAGRFILLGSAVPDLIRDSSESLAGRIMYINIHPFNLQESNTIVDQKTLWFNGGFPRSLFAPDPSMAHDWLQGFIRTYLDKDLPLLGLPVLPPLSSRLWTMLAHLNGQVLNYSLLAKSLEISSVSVKNYIDFFENAFLIRRLSAYSRNIKKRIIKAPKLYFTDTGILHQLLNVQEYDQLLSFPAVGNSWEAFCIQQIHSSIPENCQTGYYLSQDGAECDLIIEAGGDPVASIEVKFSNAPKISKGNYIAMKDINAPYNFILTPGSDDFPLNKEIRVCSLEKFIFHHIPNILENN